MAHILTHYLGLNSDNLFGLSFRSDILVEYFATVTGIEGISRGTYIGSNLIPLERAGLRLRLSVTDVPITAHNQQPKLYSPRNLEIGDHDFCRELCETVSRQAKSIAIIQVEQPSELTELLRNFPIGVIVPRQYPKGQILGISFYFGYHR